MSRLTLQLWINNIYLVREIATLKERITHYSLLRKVSSPFHGLRVVPCKLT